MAPKFIIYALQDPTTMEIRYIGRSCSGLVRPKQHTFPSSLKHPNPKNDWLRPLAAQGLKPTVIVLQEVESASHLDAQEEHWIELALSFGWRLTNLTLGGPGLYGKKHSSETIAKMKDARKKKWTDPKYREEMAQKKRPPVSEEARINMSKAQRARMQTPEGKASIKKASLAAFAATTPEQRSRNSALSWAPELRERQRAVRRRENLRPETIVKMREARLAIARLKGQR
jgi:hypothetical protein